MEMHKWSLGNGQPLEMAVCGPNTTWPDVGGIYIFTYRGPRAWVPLYVWHAESLAEALTAHPRWGEASQMGASHVHTARVALEPLRRAWTEMLIRTHRPPLNP